jgi:hypothetical protein
MLPTCIGISGVSRYKKDASSEDSFLPSPILLLPRKIAGAFRRFSLGMIVHFSGVTRQGK